MGSLNSYGVQLSRDLLLVEDIPYNFSAKWGNMHSSATADNNYRQAVHKLVAACTFLKRHLPPDDDEDPELITPPNRPKPRTVNVACVLCATELENLECDARDQHICTHQPGLHEGNRQDD